MSNTTKNTQQPDRQPSKEMPESFNLNPPAFSFDLPAADLSKMRGELHQKIEREKGVRAWLRSRSTAIRWLLLSAAATLIVLAVFILTRRPDFTAYPIPRMTGILSLFFLLIVGSYWLELRPLHKALLPRWQFYILIILAVAAPWFAALLPDAYSGHMISTEGHDHIRQAIPCLIFGLVTGGPFLLLGWLFDRASFRFTMQPLAMASAAALIGNFTLQLHCPITNPIHLVLGHASVILPLFLIFILLKILQKRRK